MDLSRDESTRRLRRGSGKEVKEQILSFPSGSAREDNEVHEKAHGSDGWAASEIGFGTEKAKNLHAA